MERVLLLDGDVFAYRACRPRWKTKAKMAGENSVVSLDENGEKIPLEYTKDEDTKYLMDSWDNFQKDIAELMEELFADTYIMAVKGPDNFRDDLYPDYKMQRGKNKHHQSLSSFVPTIRKLAVRADMAIEAVGREADDYLRIWASQCEQEGIEYIVVSIDKDLLCIPGRHYRLKEKKLLTVTPEDGMRFYYEQLLQGDPTDNIPGVPGIGPVHAKRELMYCQTEEQFQEVVISHYFAAYGDDWANNLLINGKLIHIQRTPEDYFDLKNWPLANELLGR